MRQIIVISYVLTNSFNPRTHEGCDRSSDCSTCRSIARFNPRTHEGCDSMLDDEEAMEVVFQSTHPRGVRPTGRVLYGTQKRFQSTHPRGVRLPARSCYVRLLQFQSTHPRGVRLTSCFGGPRGITVSIHAPTRGAT